MIWIAYWNKFGIPEKQPSYVGVDIEFLVDRPRQGGRAASQVQEPELNTRREMTRRELLALGAAAAASPLIPGRAFAAVPADQELHGLSAFGDLKYGPDFTHFDYANLEAPKGGTFNFGPSQWVFNQNPYTFNTLNSFVAKGDAPPRMEMCFDSLMASALDEPDSIYGLLAKTVTVSLDRNSFEFALRPEARFHDGSPLTAEDAAFTFKLFKENGHPDLLLSLTELTEAVALDAGRLRLTFSGKQSGRTILDVATFPILSKSYFDKVPFDSSRMEPPLGSGPYKVGLVNAGQTIEFERVADYWGRDLPVNRGMFNFDRLRIEFYGDRQAAFEAFKKGEVHFREEATSRIWATGYDFPAINAGKVVKREFPSEKRPAMQAIAVNQRRERFRDVRVRRAIALCFDFEWTNRSLFYGLYDRSQSCFERSEFKASGAARARRTGTTRAAARQAARRSLRRGVSAAKLRRQRTRQEAARRSAQADDRSWVEAFGQALQE